MSDDCKFCGFIILGLIFVFNFVFGLSELIIAGVHYNEFDSSCYDIRSYIIVAGIFDFGSSIILGCLLKFLYNGTDKSIRICTLLQIFQICPIIIMIWSANIYFNISYHCKSFLTYNAPEIWEYVILLHFALMWIGVIALLFTIIIAAFIWLIKLFCRMGGQ
jgi:hypothetical protein